MYEGIAPGEPRGRRDEERGPEIVARMTTTREDRVAFSSVEALTGSGSD